MNRYLMLVTVNFKMIVRNWTSLFWMFLFPVIIMWLLGTVLGNEGAGSAKIAIVDMDKTTQSRDIVKAFDNIDAIIIEKGEKFLKIKKLRAGNLDAVLIIEKGFSKTASAKPGNLTLHYDPSKTFSSSMVRSTIHSVLGSIEKKMSRTPTLIKVKEKREAAKGMDFIDFLLPGIIAMSIMQTAVFGLSTALVTYREQGILRRLKITPLPLSNFLSARIIVLLCISIIQTAILIIFAQMAFGVHIQGSLLLLTLVVVIGSLFFLTLGFLVASFAGTTESADTIGNIITMPMMFLSGVFFPMETAPAWIKPFISVLPLKFLADSLRDVTVKAQNLSYIQNNLIILSVMTIVLFFIVIRMFRWESKPS